MKRKYTVKTSGIAIAEFQYKTKSTVKLQINVPNCYINNSVQNVCFNLYISSTAEFNDPWGYYLVYITGIRSIGTKTSVNGGFAFAWLSTYLCARLEYPDLFMNRTAIKHPNVIPFQSL